jgi:putative endonuclease
MVIVRHGVRKSSLRGAQRRSNLGGEGDEIATPAYGGLAMTGDDNMNRQYYVYLMTNPRNSVLYAGVTNDLRKRCFEHKEKLAKGFTAKYNVVKLVYYEVFEDVANAISREKQLKAGSRQRKIELVNSVNKEWRDLYEGL